MANTKSAKKQARKNITRREINLARRTAMKTSIKKVITALEQEQDEKTIQTLLRQAEAKLARAKGKGLIHARTASRKVSRLAKKVAQATKK